MPKKEFISPSWIGMLMPDHKDPTCKKAEYILDCATFHSSMEEITMEPLLEKMFTMAVECPKCGETGMVAIAVWHLQDDPMMRTKCRRCNEPFMMRDGQALYFAGHRRKE